MLRIVISSFFVLGMLVAPVAATPDAKQLAKARVTAAEKVYANTLVMMKSGRTTVEGAYVWSIRWLDAELANGKAIKAALADHLERMVALEISTATSVQAGAMSSLEQDATSYYRIEADLWVARGKR